MKTMKKWNYVVSAVMAVLGILIITASLSFKTFLPSGDPGPGFWPMLIGGIIVLCSILLTVTSKTNAAAEEKKTVSFWSPAHVRVYKMMAASVVFCLAMYFLGFYVAMIIFIPIAMKLMGTESDKTIVLTTVFMVLFIFAAFQIGLKTTLPAPIFSR